MAIRRSSVVARQTRCDWYKGERLRMKKIWIIAAFLLCSCAADDSDRFGTVHSPILYGEQANNTDFGSVVAIAIAGNGNGDKAYYAYCSGVLIAENVVLTAAHCVTDDVDLPFKSLFRGNKIVIVADENADAPASNRVFEVADFRANPDYDALTNMNDIGLLWLKSPVPEDVAAPVSIVTDYAKVKSIVDTGQEVDFVGFGVDENGNYNQRLFWTGKLDMWCSESWCPIDKTVKIPYGTVKSDLENGGPCNGDSGGAVLVMLDGTRHVLAVTSFGDEKCADYAVSTSVAAHQRWLNNTLYPSKKKSGGCSIGGGQNVENIYVFAAMILIFMGIFVNRVRAKLQGYRF